MPHATVDPPHVGAGTTPAGTEREPAEDGSSGPPVRRAWRRGAALVVVAAIVVLVGVRGRDLIAVLARSVPAAVTTISWPVLAVLAATGVVHYVAAALAVRAAADASTPLPTLVASQLVAAAANRLTPSGLGGAAITARFLRRRAGLDLGAAGAAIATLALLGGVSDVVTFAVLLGAGLTLHDTAAARELPTLVTRLAGVVPHLGPVGWCLVTLVGTVVGVVMIRSARPDASQLCLRVRDVGRAFGGAVQGLSHRPRRFVTVIAASATTTAVLAGGFAVVAVLGPATMPPTAFLALMIGYMAASAVGNAVPVPGGVGGTDAALVGVLLSAGVPATAALTSVLTFRLLTFWAPALIGAALVRPLRHRGAL